MALRSIYVAAGRGQSPCAAKARVRVLVVGHLRRSLLASGQRQNGVGFLSPSEPGQLGQHVIFVALPNKRRLPHI